MCCTHPIRQGSRDQRLDLTVSGQWLSIPRLGAAQLAAGHALHLLLKLLAGRSAPLLPPGDLLAGLETSLKGLLHAPFAP